MTSILENLGINLKEIKDKKIRKVIPAFFNIIEDQAKTVKNLQAENQKLRDEINLLKGEQKKLDIKGKNQKKDEDEDDDNPGNGTNISSEKERKEKTPRQKRSKKGNISIDRTEECPVNKNELPDDAEWKGYESVVVQDISFSTDNVEFLKERYYSSSLNKTFTGKLRFFLVVFLLTYPH